MNSSLPIDSRSAWIGLGILTAGLVFVWLAFDEEDASSLPETPVPSTFPIAQNLSNCNHHR